MSNRTTAQKLARALQRITQDELGVKPKLQGCHNIIRDQLKASGERRDATSLPPTVEEQGKDNAP